MKAAKIVLALSAFVLMACSDESVGQVVVETGDLRLEAGADGRVRSVRAAASNVEYMTGEPMPMASVYRGGEMRVGSQEQYGEHELPVYRGGRRYPASAAELKGDVMTVRFGEAKVTATYKVTRNAAYVGFKLVSLEGEPVDRIDLMQLRVKRLANLGTWIDVAWDEQFGICLCGGNIKTTAGMKKFADLVEMRAVATREVGLEGATAVLFGCAGPREQFLERMEIVERDYGMPPGARSRRSPMQDYSYLWCSPTPNDVDQYIALAKRAGFRMILFSYGAFTRGAGHFNFNERFPGELGDLKEVTGKIRAAGLKVGIHIHYSKADRTDPYVTPVPDDRFHKLRTFTLSGGIDEKTTSIPVKENPEGCTMVNERRILKIGKELVSYGGYTTKAPYQFTGCQRGHLKTAAGKHAEGESAGLLDVDDWTRFIRFDQSTDIQDEAARRLAEIINGSGPYDMVYFDGAEDVHHPFWYHVANAQYRVFRLFEPVPPICEAAMNGHFGWHMMSRGNAYDVDGGYIKNFCREISCRTAPIRAQDFTRIEFGWIAAFYRDMGPDALEYVLSRGAAWDCPFSIRATLADVAKHPRGEDCLEVIKTWENARIAGRLTQAQRNMLKTLPASEYYDVKIWDALFASRWTNLWSKSEFKDQEHHLFVNEKGEYELVPVREVTGVGGGRVKAYVFERANEAGNTYALVWAVEGEKKLALPVAPRQVRLMRPFGTRLGVEGSGGTAVVTVGRRSYLRFAGMGRDEVVSVLMKASDPR